MYCPSIASLFQQYSSNPSSSVMHLLSMLLNAASFPFCPLCVCAHTYMSTRVLQCVWVCMCGGDSRGEPSWSCWNFLQILLVLKLSSPMWAEVLLKAARVITTVIMLVLLITLNMFILIGNLHISLARFLQFWGGCYDVLFPAWAWLIMACTE